MKCKKAIWVDTIGMNVPCGQCMPCRINRGRKWSARIIMEWLYCPLDCYFLTFTIDDEHQEPIWETREGKTRKVGTVRKKWFLQWINDACKDLGLFRYYAIGEYGDLGGRAHYHLAVFPKHPAQVPALRARWKKGFVSASPLNHARARYLANYTGKKLTKLTDQRLQPGQEPEFRSSSRRPPLGEEFCQVLIARYKSPKGAKLLAERGDIPRSFRVDGKIYPIGDWALRKIRTELGIPLTHTGRCKHPNYERYYPLEEAEWDPEEAIKMEKQIDAKKKAKLYRGESPKL